MDTVQIFSGVNRGTDLSLLLLTPLKIMDTVQIFSGVNSNNERSVPLREIVLYKTLPPNVSHLKYNGLYLYNQPDWWIYFKRFDLLFQTFISV